MEVRLLGGCIDVFGISACESISIVFQAVEPQSEPYQVLPSRRWYRYVLGNSGLRQEGLSNDATRFKPHAL